MIKNYRINESKATMESMGAEELTTEELLSIILGNQEKAAKILHQEDALFKATQDDLKHLVRQDYDSLKNVGNLTKNETARIFAAIELGKRIANMPNTEAKRISSPGDAAQHLMAGLRYATHEKFVVVLLDTKNHVMKTKQISEGSLSSSVVHPREVFAPAVTAHAASIVVAHNHPSGNTHPSQQDKDLTYALTEAGTVLGIPLIDHLIIGDGTYYSFKEHGDI